MSETDVNTIRSLILEDKDLACQIREKAQMLHLSKAEVSEEDKETSGRVGEEFIDLLVKLRIILGQTHEALTGFNG